MRRLMSFRPSSGIESVGWTACERGTESGAGEEAPKGFWSGSMRV